jgi:uncharacterized membrane protein
MNMRLVLALSLLPGIAMGALGVFGILDGLHLVLWLAIAVGSAVLLARRAPGRFFLHGFTAGFIAMCVSTLVELAFLPQYLEHNTRAADSFQKLPAEWPLALVIVVAMPFTSALYACVTGALALGARPLRRHGQPAPLRH